MALTYTTYLTTMAGLLSISPESALSGQTALVEAMISYAESRIYRECDFLRTVVEEVTSDLTPGTRTIAVPDDIYIVNSIWLISPASTAPAAGTRAALQRVSIEYLNFFWPTAATQGTPLVYAMQDDLTITIAPTPAAAMRLAVVGIERPAPLSSGNPTTFLTDELPDLFTAASMIFGMGGLNQNFGAQAEDPQSSQSWESQYQTLKESVNMDAIRQKAWAQSWQPFSPAPIAKDSRT